MSTSKNKNSNHSKDDKAKTDARIKEKSESSNDEKSRTGATINENSKHSKDAKASTNVKTTENCRAVIYEQKDCDDHHPESYSKLQQQTLKQHQRSAEASAQMVYGVYGNVIAILEEWEKRELKNKNLKQQLPRSEIDLPSQSHKKDKDVTTIVEAQLLLLESQLRTCRSEIRDKVKEQLLELTLQWNAARQNQQLPTDLQTDHYAGQLVEILLRGSASHPDKFRQSPGDVEGVTQKDMETVLGAQHKTVELDKQFEDTKKKAETPKIRPGDVKQGAERLQSTRSDLMDLLLQNRIEEPMDIK